MFVCAAPTPDNRVAHPALLLLRLTPVKSLPSNARSHDRVLGEGNVLDICDALIIGVALMPLPGAEDGWQDADFRQDTDGQDNYLGGGVVRHH